MRIIVSSVLCVCAAIVVAAPQGSKYLSPEAVAANIAVRKAEKAADAYAASIQTNANYIAYTNAVALLEAVRISINKAEFTVLIKILQQLYGGQLLDKAAKDAKEAASKPPKPTKP